VNAKLLAPLVLLASLMLATFLLDGPAPRAEVTFVDRDEIFTLDPQRMSWMQDFRMAYALYEPLVRWDNRDFTIVPGAAELPEISPDRLTYTFHIRADAKWSNGASVTAHDYIYSWMRALLPDTAADYTMMFFCIEGAEEFFHWRQEQLSGFVESGMSAIDLWRVTESRFAELVGLRALDDQTLEIRLARPIPYFLDLVAFGVFHPVYRPCVEGWRLDDATESEVIARGWPHVAAPAFEGRSSVALNAATGALEQQHEWTKPGRLVSNGPYVLAQWRYKRGLRLERNPYYHSPQMVKAESVESLSISEPNTAVLAFDQGEIDWLSEVSVEYLADLVAQRLRYESRYRSEIDEMLQGGATMDQALADLPPPEEGERRNIHVLPTFGTDFYSFNCRPTLADGRANPFHDAAVRRAFVAATDRNAIVKQVTRLNEPVVTTLIPPGSIPNYEDQKGIGFDVDTARRDLTSAGWMDRDGDGLIENEDGEPFPVIDLLYSTNTPRYKAISLALRDMWQRSLGVRVELRGKENKAFKEDLRAGNFMIGRGRWYGDYGDPTTFLDICKTGDGNNDRGYSNEYVDTLLEEASREVDPQKRMDLFEECERYLFQDDPPMIVLCTLVQVYMYEPGRVRGLTHHPRLSQYLWRMEVEE
jgi:oligopeptide transport system substrate-binding protein